MSKFQQSLQDTRGRASAFWLARTEQERKFLGVGGAILALALFYSVLLDPALSGREVLNKELPKMRQQAAEMQVLAREAETLRGQTSIAPPPMTRESLNASLAARSLTPQSLSITGDFAKVQFNNAAHAGIVAWLDAIRVESRIAVQDASFTAQEPAGTVNATLTLRQSVQ